MKLAVCSTESLDKSAWRTHMHLTYGEIFEIPEEIKQMHFETLKNSPETPTKEWPAVAAIMALYKPEFAKVVIQAPDWRTKNRAHLARKLFQPDSHSLSLLDRYYDTQFFLVARDFIQVPQRKPQTLAQSLARSRPAHLLLPLAVSVRQARRNMGFLTWLGLRCCGRSPTHPPTTRSFSRQQRS